MEPWLDGLSEEWNSEPHTSPRSNLSQDATGKSNTSRRASGVTSQSRIPHLAHNIRIASSSNNNSNGNSNGNQTGSFLKPRSSRGIARLRESTGSVLVERSASSLNALPQSPMESSRRRVPSAIPRRASSVLSDSQTSVQHHTVDKSVLTQETLEWKRRLQEGEDPVSDGFDLFSPSKLEGMFKQSSCPVEIEDIENDENKHSIVIAEKRPWNTLSDTAFPPPSDNFVLNRTSKGRPSSMDTVQEVEEEDEKTFNLSNISSDIVRNGSIKGLVKRRVSSLEMTDLTNQQHGSLRTSNDPRMRTISGRKEMSNEVFSPLEDSERSSIRKQALQDTLDTDPVEVRKRLHEARKLSTRRSNPRCSDHDISYDGPGLNKADSSILPDDHAAEMTSQSLPEDLSMGTQNYQPNSILEVVTNQRPKHGHENLAARKRSSSGPSTSILNAKNFRSSPPPYKRDNIEESKLSLSESSSLIDDSVVHHFSTSIQHSATGSPLKLFGNRDTYTNNKLMRVLSQFEDEQSDLKVPDEIPVLRMSNFGKGELDAFGFDKEVEHYIVEEKQPQKGVAKVFKSIAPLIIQNESTSTIEVKTSPTKERSPKRRRTLLKDEIFVDGTEVEIKLSALPDNSIAGKKRRDALPGNNAEQASPDTMASRSVLRPSTSRKSSDDAHSRTASASEVLRNVTVSAPQLEEQLAAELESFAGKATEAKVDSRKPSLATKDYMEEANKVMEFIRARGKPKPVLPDIQEPEEVSELNPDAILDLEIEDDSTKDSFSRPPSREGRPLPKVDRRHAQHDARIANHLDKFRDADDLELLASTSALGTLHLVDNKLVDEAALVPVPEDVQFEIEESFQSEPPGMRILNENDRKRKHSASDVDTIGAQQSLDINSDGSKRTIASSSSTGSRGIISQGTVSIPDTIGIMTFDREKKTWVKQRIPAPRLPAPSVSPASKVGRQDVSEADPFDGIPDLSIDEMGEATWKKNPKHWQNLTRIDEKTDSGRTAKTDDIVVAQSPKTKILAPAKSSLKSPRRQRLYENVDGPLAKGSVAAKQEERLHNGFVSEDVDRSGKQQARVVTIAFTSPIASDIPYIQPPSVSDADIDEDDPSQLPLDDEGSVLDGSPVKLTDDLAPLTEEDALRHRTVMGSVERHEQYRAMTLNRRPVSRIEEYDEEQEDNQELSLIHVKRTDLTPMPTRQMGMMKAVGKRESSILCLTPLSEFTLHQVDKLNHPEESFVADRANPKALKQAHGSHALVEDALVKAITDAEPSELFWEQLRRLSMPASGLAALHGLKDYCSSLEYLDVRSNKIVQLTDIPVSIRSLGISSNLVNDLTSWTHLHNLQTVDVSKNQLESMECFSGLVHLRHLKASDNKIRNIEGVLDLTGLITLDLSGNDVPEVDFQGSELLCLEEINLSKNNLMHAKNLDCLPKLKYADFTNNLLEELIIAEDKVVQYLTTLCLAQNELRELDLSAFPNIEKVNLDSNMITCIHSLAEAEHLTILSARDQRVPSTLINDILTSNHDCSELYLSANALPGAGLTLPKQPNFTLRCLELASCGIDTVPHGFGDLFPNLRVLNLNFNALTDLTALQGSIKLKQLLVAKNRIAKMRRTCLTLSRLQTLKKVDLRDNPLTIGFHPPMHEATDDSQRPHCLPVRKAEQDHQWLGLMDEVTWLRRRAMELLLAECCPGLDSYDGLHFDRAILMKEKATWQRLMGKGVLSRRQSEKKVESTETVKDISQAHRRQGHETAA